MPFAEAMDETAAELAARQAEYSARGLTAAGLSLFHDFLRAAAGAALLAILPALAMRCGSKAVNGGIPNRGVEADSEGGAISLQAAAVASRNSGRVGA